MILVRPNYEILTKFDGNEVVKFIEQCGRICYKSEDKITEISAERFVRNVIDRGHESVIEHFNVSVKFIIDRGVSHELVRHRLAAYCVSEDTKLLRFCQNRGHLTIKDLYDRQLDNNLNGRNKLMKLRSVNEKGFIVPNGFTKIIKSGIKDVYQVKTKLGYKIVCSEDHVFITKDGERKLNDLRIGSKVLVNGVFIYQDKNWLKDKYWGKNLSLAKIADLANCSISSIRKYIRQFDLQKPLGSKPLNFTPWNKGLNEFEDKRVKNQANALRKFHHNNLLGEQNSAWKGDKIESISGKRLRFSKMIREKCELCGKQEKLENHHLDNNPENYNLNNKQTLCVDCHKLIHKGYNVKKVIEDEIVSILYVGRKMTYDIEMRHPYHNVVADGFVVHNSQESTRYGDYSKRHVTFIIPLWVDIEPGTYTSDEWIVGNINFCQADVDWYCCMLALETYYKKLITLGWTPQQARSVLPNSLKTEIVMTANLREWRHVLKLRTSSAAHPQMREVMIPLLKEFYNKIPCIFEDIVGGVETS